MKTWLIRYLNAVQAALNVLKGRLQEIGMWTDVSLRSDYSSGEKAERP